MNITESASTRYLAGDAGERVQSPLAAHLTARLAAMPPSYFAMVMATGIVAIASQLFGFVEFAAILSRLNMVIYPVLWLLFLCRVVLFRERVVADGWDHGRAPGYFTIVAATGVLGTQLALLHQWISIAHALWWFCFALWGTCTYTIFTLLTVREGKPSLAEGINGGWLVAVVATQSVCVLGCTLDGLVFSDRDAALFVMLSLWLGGGMLYLWIIGLIFYRYMFFPFSPKDLLPPYWINMGAVAISTLAGALLAGKTVGSELLGPLRPFILGLTVMFWATATWWIPMLLVLGVWRHLLKGVRLSYDPLYWGLVFPVGMYAVCTYRLAEALHAPFLLWIARAVVVVAPAAWLLAFLGLGGRLLYAMMLGLRRPSGANPNDADATLTIATQEKGRLTS